jgi:hypothetical protein
MTTPPPEPPQDGWPPPGYPNYPPYGPYPGYPPPRKQSSTGLILGLAAVGAFAYFAVNFVVVILVLMLAADQPTSGGVILAGTIGLALFAFGVGGVLVALRKPWAMGLGLGLMIGWALTSIFTVGICTGINPSIYGGL